MAILTTSYQLLAQNYLGTSGGSLYVRIYAKYSEQDIINNRSKVQYQSRAYYENGNYIYDAAGSGNVSGTSASTISGSCTRPTRGETVIATTEAWVYHNDNGSKSISASGYLNFPNWGWSATASGSADLPSIPRASSIAVSNYDLGQNIGITIGKKVNSFTSTLTYKIGDRTGNIVNKTTEISYVWYMSDELINQIKQDNPKNAKLIATIYCETYSGDTKIGSTQSATFTLTIIDKPTIDNVVINETIDLIKQYTTSIVKYLSVPQFNISSIPSEGTTIKTYRVKIGDREIVSYNDGLTINNIQYSYLVDNVRKTKFIITVTDARGNISDEYPLELDFIEYIQLAFNNTDIILTRENATSNYMKIHMTGYVYNGLVGNTENNLIIQYRYKIKNDYSAEWSEFKNLTPTLKENNTFIIDNFQLEDEFDYRENYDIEFYAEDLFTKVDYATIIKTSETIVKVHKNGIDVKNLTIRGNEIYPIGSIYMSVNDINPGILFGGVWEQIKDRFLLGAGDIYKAGSIGGEAEHTLTEEEMPRHRHPIAYDDSSRNFYTSWGESGSHTGLIQTNGDNQWQQPYADWVGGSQPHNNMPPYLTVYMWERVE